MNNNDIIKTKMNKAPNRKRCEFALKGILKRDTKFKLSFDIKMNNNFTYYSNYHMLFQIHGYPDTGESWRCPILALESVNGTFRMYNRWDKNLISTTTNGTCSKSGNTINSRTLFTDYPYEAKTWYNIELNGTLSYTSDSCLTVKINDVIQSDICGKNTYNDSIEPYFKFGIYKPTSWETTDEKIIAKYRNITYKEL